MKIDIKNPETLVASNLYICPATNFFYVEAFAIEAKQIINKTKRKRIRKKLLKKLLNKIETKLFAENFNYLVFHDLIEVEEIVKFLIFNVYGRGKKWIQ